MIRVKGKGSPLSFPPCAKPTRSRCSHLVVSVWDLITGQNVNSIQLIKSSSSVQLNQFNREHITLTTAQHNLTVQGLALIGQMKGGGRLWSDMTAGNPLAPHQPPPCLRLPHTATETHHATQHHYSLCSGGLLQFIYTSRETVFEYWTHSPCCHLVKGVCKSNLLSAQCESIVNHTGFISIRPVLFPRHSDAARGANQWGL